MTCIVCATRGGQGSRAAQLEAVRLAKEMEARLIFLYVVDVSSVGEIEPLLLQAVRDEFRWLGRALLRIAQQRAERAGIEADIVLREGQVQKEIARFLHDSQAALLLIGAPRGTTRLTFGDDSIELFAQAIEAQTGVPVTVARPEDAA